MVTTYFLVICNVPLMRRWLQPGQTALATTVSSCSETIVRSAVSHPKAGECRPEGPADFSKGQGRHPVVAVFPGDFRLHLPSTEDQGACCRSLWAALQAPVHAVPNGTRFREKTIQ